MEPCFLPQGISFGTHEAKAPNLGLGYLLLRGFCRCLGLYNGLYTEA